MPAGYAHLMITDKALDGFRRDEAIDKGLRGYPLKISHFVQLGCLGPDYPYLDFFQPSQKAWADHMHYDLTGDLLKTFARKLVELKASHQYGDEFTIPFCWTLGYISHVTADLVVHPVIFNIVGPYVGNEPDHRHCEMIQDAFIYNRIRNGAEIKYSALLDVVKNASDPNDEDKINPFLRSFWEYALRTHFTDDYATNSPKVDAWHDYFEDFLGFAGSPSLIGRFVDPDHKFTYKRSNEITADERKRFLEDLPLPDGSRRDYVTLFEIAVSRVLERWTTLAKGLALGEADGFVAGVKNCDLDTGKEKDTGKLTYWV